MNGQWVTLHIQHFGGKEDRTLLGFLAAQSNTPGYKLTKLAIQQKTHNEEGTCGTHTIIHEGTWIVSPQFVWMVEYEDASPVPGFAPGEEY